MKKIKFLATLFFIFLLTACSKEKKRSFTFFDSFDTEISIIMYTKTNDEFEKYIKIFKEEFTNYGKLYNIYKDYDGITNLKTINPGRQFPGEGLCKQGRRKEVPNRIH